MPVDGWHEYEEEVLDILLDLGYQACLSDKIHGEQDGGIDIEVRDPSDRRIVVQCKYYQGLVGSQAIQRIAGWLSDESVYQAVIVTPIGYTNQAVQWASNKPGLYLHTTDTLRSSPAVITSVDPIGMDNACSVEPRWSDVPVGGIRYPIKSFREKIARFVPKHYFKKKSINNSQYAGFMSGCILGSITIILYTFGPYIIAGLCMWFMWSLIFGFFQ